MDDVKAKQQTIEKIKASTSILIAVSNDPSVDALSAALGLTLLLDKLQKHPTAIFSGTVPPAIAFLEPEKTFDDTTDSLRDFIIALDKEKADHLRLSKDGDMVRIFITPYKTHLTEADLTFSQGDFNVELVIALGVDNQDHLDSALAGHGQILHDATIITVTAADQTSTLGGIDWYDPQASSLSEMVTGLAEALKTDKNTSLLDQQIATALLTGIVAATDRFSNTHTTARAMTVASQLMADGADQQLIASKLEQTYQTDEQPSEPKPKKAVKKDDSSDDSLSIAHEGETLAELDQRVRGSDGGEATPEAVEETTQPSAEAEKPAAPEPVKEEATEPQEVSNVQAGLTGAYAPEVTDEAAEPSLGGTLNATTEQAAIDAQNAANDDQNKTILSHSYLDTAPSFSTPINGAADDASAAPAAVTNAYAPDPQAEPAPQTTSAPTPATPAELGLPMPPPLPDFSATPPVMPSAPITPPTISVPPTTPAPERLGDILAPEPTPAPLDAGPAIVTLPGEHVIQPLTNGPIVPDPVPSAPATPADPTQFKIPGQP